MQNENKPSRFRRFLRDNGYYLVIAVCALAIGVSGFFLLRNEESSEPEPEALSVPVTTHTGETKSSVKQQPVKPVKPAVSATPKDPEPVSVPQDAAEEALAPAVSVPEPRTVAAPVSGETLASYSVTSLAYNETTRDWRTHDALDLAAELGSAVCAAENGTVCAVYADDYLGMTVEISHASGYTTVYSNLAAEPCVTVGQTVSVGDPIGAVGNSALIEVGQAPHLHFAVRKDGMTVDPAVYLAG